MARPTGSSNKNKAFLLTRLQEMYGEDFHPIMNMAENAVKLQKAADLDPEPNNFKAALDGWEKIAQYVEPKLKAIEHTGTVGVEAYELSETERSARIAALLDAAGSRRARQINNDGDGEVDAS